MVERLKLAMQILGLALVFWPAAHAARAQTVLADPTRPPSASAGLEDGVTAPVSRLQSILISPRRRVAVIDGRTVAIGEKVQQATLVQIFETHVTLRSGNELTTLELYPGIRRREMQPVGGAGMNKDNQ